MAGSSKPGGFLPDLSSRLEERILHRILRSCSKSHPVEQETSADAALQLQQHQSHCFAPPESSRERGGIGFSYPCPIEKGQTGQFRQGLFVCGSSSRAWSVRDLLRAWKPLTRDWYPSSRRWKTSSPALPTIPPVGDRTAGCILLSETTGIQFQAIRMLRGCARKLTTSLSLHPGHWKFVMRIPRL